MWPHEDTHDFKPGDRVRHAFMGGMTGKVLPKGFYWRPQPMWGIPPQEQVLVEWDHGARQAVPASNLIKISDDEST